MERMKISNDGLDGRIACNQWMMKMIVIFLVTLSKMRYLLGNLMKKKKNIKKEGENIL